MNLSGLRKGDVVSIRHYTYIKGQPLIWRVHDFKVVSVYPPGHFVNVEPRPGISKFTGFHRDSVLKRKEKAM